MKLALLFFIAARAVVLADNWPPPPPSRTVLSIDGSARIAESSSGTGLERSIKVYAQSGAASETLSWQTTLVNCPILIFVAPGGKTVVTMDTWGSAGSDALVFYGDHGRVLKRYARAEKDLVTEAEALKIGRTVSSFWWSRGAHAEFTANGEYFWVWLPSGRVMLFDVKTGNPVDAEAVRLDPDRGRRTVSRTCETLAASETPKQRIAAARLAGWLNGEAVLPLLRKLLSDPYHEDTGEQRQAQDDWGRFGDRFLFLHRRVYPVRRAAAEELHIAFGQTEAPVEELIAR